MKALLLLFAACTDSNLVVPGAPVTCATLGGHVDGALVDPEGASTAFGAVQVTRIDPDVIAFFDGVLQLQLGIGTPPRIAYLFFPSRTVFATDGKVIIDDSTTCAAGRFDLEFVYHGVLTGSFAVPP